MDAIEHGEIVLSGILPARKDLLDTAIRRLTPDHFADRTQSTLFQMLDRFANRSGTVLPAKYLGDVLRSKPDGTALLFTEAYTKFAQTPVDDADFLWSLDQLIELAAEKATGEAITQAMTILRTGMPVEGEEEPLRGHEAARGHLLEALSTIDRQVTMQEAPEGDVRDEASDILSEYAERRKAHLAGDAKGIQFGIASLDAKIGGLQNGEVCLLAGYSSDGKTTLAVQLAWSAAIEQGKNVAFMTTETLRPQVIRKLLARHSTQEMFGLPTGLNTRDLKAGTLSPTEEGKYTEVVADFTTNPDYGRIYIVQVPRGSTITSIEQRLYRIQRGMHIDLVVMDYLALLSSDRKRQTSREELASIMKETKQVATTFDAGRGVPIVSPWQVTRAAREQAEKIGLYSSASLSETAEATNTADIIVSLMAPTDNTNRNAEVTGQVLKNRDGETANGLIFAVDYATSKFVSRGGLQFAPIPQAGAAVAGGLEALI